jgi:hypothetical protein
MSNRAVIRSDAYESTVVDVANDSTTVASKPCRLGKVYINTALSAHALPIYDGATLKLTLPASAAAGTSFDFWGMRFKSSLIVDPNDAATGNITVLWDPM